MFNVQNIILYNNPKIPKNNKNSKALRWNIYISHAIQIYGKGSIKKLFFKIKILRNSE